MTLKVKYEGAEEAQFRLQGTVVLYDGAPVYISSVNSPEAGMPKEDTYRVFIQNIPVDGRSEAQRKLISSGKFDLTPFRMGFMNLDGEAIYLSRNSARQNRQGLGERTLDVQSLDKDKPSAERPRFNRLIGDKAFLDMVKGEYPAIEQAVALLNKEEARSVAVSREYALGRHETLEDLLILYHKHTVVGFMETEGKAFKIGKKFKFLKEELEERKIPYRM